LCSSDINVFSVVVGIVGLSKISYIGFYSSLYSFGSRDDWCDQPKFSISLVFHHVIDLSLACPKFPTWLSKSFIVCCCIVSVCYSIQSGLIRGLLGWGSNLDGMGSFLFFGMWWPCSLFVWRDGKDQLIGQLVLDEINHLSW
jgi:hypothetical protein